MRLRHQSTHASQLPDLVAATPAARIVHQPDGVETTFNQGQVVHHGLGNVVVGVGPSVDHLVIPFPERDLPRGIRLLEALDSFCGCVDNLALFVRYLEVFYANGNAPLRGMLETEVLQSIKELHRFRQTGTAIGLEDEVGQHPLPHHFVWEAEIRDDFHGKNATEQHSARSRGNPPRRCIAGALWGLVPVVHRRLVPKRPCCDAHLHFRQGADMTSCLELFLEIRGLLGHDIAAEHHILRWFCDRPTIRRLQHVITGKHQHPCFELTLERQRNVHRHLIAVEVCVERSTDKGVYPNRLPLNQHRLERLNAEPMKCRCPVE